MRKIRLGKLVVPLGIYCRPKTPQLSVEFYCDEFYFIDRLTKPLWSSKPFTAITSYF